MTKATNSADSGRALAASRHAKTPRASGASLGFEAQLWAAADKMRGHMDAAEYKHVVLGLIFLKYISDSFQVRYDELVARQDKEHANPEDRDEFAGANVFWVPVQSRWRYIQGNAKRSTIGRVIDEAMIAIEKENPCLENILPKNYGRQALDKRRLGGLIDVISEIGLGDDAARSKDILGRVYEYFLGRFATAEGKGGGEFYTPQCVVRTLVRMIEPYKGRVFDPCCGSGGMFVQSERFVEEHGGRVGDIAVYGQESNPTTWRLAKMNLAIRGIDADLGQRCADSFHNDLHRDLRADYILANPPFNMSDWGGDRLHDDPRWAFGAPPQNNANYAWIQHFAHHLAPNGMAAFVMANGSMSTGKTAELRIRKNMIEADLIDCMVALPGQLFYTTQIPVCLWVLTRGKNKARCRAGEILFIDARKLGALVDRTHRELSEEETDRITTTYHLWRGDSVPATQGARAWMPDGYKDVLGFCKSAALEDIRSNDWILTPGRYVGIEPIVDEPPPPRPGVLFVYAVPRDGGGYHVGRTDDLRRDWRERTAGERVDGEKKSRSCSIRHSAHAFAQEF
ncbi:MAG: class I SAM-dependent DNA methyltransferase [Myxococcota bacterium]